MDRLSLCNKYFPPNPVLGDVVNTHRYCGKADAHKCARVRRLVESFLNPLEQSSGRRRVTHPVRRDWQEARTFVDHCADEHVCLLYDFELVDIQPDSSEPRGSEHTHKRNHYGEREVHQKLKDERNIIIIITFQVCAVRLE